MRVPKESEVENRVCKYAEGVGFLVIKISPTSSNGWPDRQFILTDKIWFFIEFKKQGKKPRKLQEYRAVQLIQRGVPVYSIDTVEGGINVVDYYKRKLDPSRISREGDIFNP